MGAWNGWFHIQGHTYGTWLRGDARGWRARNHREHIDGDYKSPPPAGLYGALRKRSKELMKQSAVRLNPPQRCIAGRAMIETLLAIGVQVIAVSVSALHFHLLARFPSTNVRGLAGQAKRRSSWVLGSHGLPGTVWAKRCGVLPIKNRSHQVNVFRYILAHAGEGAWVWSFRERLCWLSDQDCRGADGHACE